MVAMLALVAWLCVVSEHGVASFMLADFVLWCWVAATVEWTPIRRLRRALEIRPAVAAYRGGAASDVLVDGQPIRRRIHGTAIAQVHTRRGPPQFVVFLLADGAIVRLATTDDRDQAFALARLVRAALLIDGEPPLHAEAPSAAGIGCAALLVMALLLLAAYLATAAAIDASGAFRAAIAFGAAALHFLLALAMRRGLELVCVRATRNEARRIFGVEA